MLPVKILLLEDDLNDIDLIKKFLDESPYFIAEVKVTDEELAYTDLLQFFLPEVVLADYRLPLFSGLEALQICKELRPDIPFIFVTGAIGEELATETVLSGASGFVLKTNLPKLNQVIIDCIEKAVKKPIKSRLSSIVNTSSRLERQIQINKEILTRAKQILDSPSQNTEVNQELNKELEESLQEMERLKKQLDNSEEQT